MRIQFNSHLKRIFLLEGDHVTWPGIGSCFAGEGDYRKHWVRRVLFMPIVHLLSVNHIVLLPRHKANDGRGLLSRFLQGGQWRRDAEWADREREATAILIVNIIYFYWAPGLWDLRIHTSSENPIRPPLSFLLQWRHSAPSNLRLRLTCA